MDGERLKDAGQVPDASHYAERFEPLEGIRSVRHSLLLRAPGIDVQMEREGALDNLRHHYRAGIAGLGYRMGDAATAEQVHGNSVQRVVSAGGFDNPVAGADGLVTNRPGTVLAILVAARFSLRINMAGELPWCIPAEKAQEWALSQGQ